MRGRLLRAEAAPLKALAIYTFVPQSEIFEDEDDDEYEDDLGNDAAARF